MIHVGDSYADLGATITGPIDADKNLGLKYFLSGKLVSDIVIDTSKVATDTIDYVAADPTGLTSTSTRTVIIEALSPPAARNGLIDFSISEELSSGEVPLLFFAPKATKSSAHDFD